MKTSTIPPSAPNWHIVDADGQTLGRIATVIAHVLRGKHKPTFSAHQQCGDHVVVINAEKLAFDQRKLEQKMYRKHTGYLGHLKAMPLKRLLEEHPERVIEKAVKGMLPHNRLSRQVMKMLHVYAGGEHPHEAQQPAPLSVS